MKLQPVIHHIEYMPSGEQPAMSADKFAEQRSSWGTSYKFNSKELDQETGLYYYGARYYNPTLSIWGSVDPMSDKYPSLSPYAYCALNPVILIDPDGRAFWEATNVKEAKKYHKIHGGSLDTWDSKGTGSTFASVSWNTSDGTANSKVFRPTNDSWGDKISKFFGFGKGDKSDRGGITLTTSKPGTPYGPAIESTSKKDDVGQSVNVDNMPTGVVPNLKTGSVLERISIIAVGISKGVDMVKYILDNSKSSETSDKSDSVTVTVVVGVTRKNGSSYTASQSGVLRCDSAEKAKQMHKELND